MSSVFNFSTLAAGLSQLSEITKEVFREPNELDEGTSVIEGTSPEGIQDAEVITNTDTSPKLEENPSSVSAEEVTKPANITSPSKREISTSWLNLLTSPSISPFRQSDNSSSSDEDLRQQLYRIQHERDKLLDTVEKLKSECLRKDDESSQFSHVLESQREIFRDELESQRETHQNELENLVKQNEADRQRDEDNILKAFDECRKWQATSEEYRVQIEQLQTNAILKSDELTAKLEEKEFLVGELHKYKEKVSELERLVRLPKTDAVVNASGVQTTEIEETDRLKLEYEEKLLSQNEKWTNLEQSWKCEREELVNESNQLIEERNALVLEKEERNTERENWSKERENWNQERKLWNSVQNSWNALQENWNSEKEKWKTEQIMWNQERDNWNKKQEKWNSENENMILERESWNSENEKWIIQRESLVQSMNQLELEYSKLLIELEQSKHNVSEKNDRIVELEDTVRLQEEQLQVARTEENNRLQANNVVTLEKAMEHHKTEMIALEDVLNQMRSRNMNLEEELNEFRLFSEKMERTIIELNSQLKAQSDELCTVKESLQTERFNFESNRLDLEKKWNESEAARNAATQKWEELKLRVQSQESSQGKLNKELDRLREHLMDQETIHTQEILTLTDQVDKLTAEMLASKARVESAIAGAERCESLERELTLERAELARTKEALQNLEAVLDTLQSQQNDKLDSRIAAMEASNVNLHKDLADKNQDLRRMNSEITEAKDEILRLKKIEEEYSVVAADCIVLLERNITLENTLQHTRSRLDNQFADGQKSIDKKMAWTLFLSYLSESNGKRKAEMMDLIVRMLDCTEEDKAALQRATGMGVGRWLFSGWSKSPESKNKANKSLAELWVDFLMAEASTMDGATSSAGDVSKAELSAVPQNATPS